MYWLMSNWNLCDLQYILHALTNILHVIYSARTDWNMIIYQTVLYILLLVICNMQCSRGDLADVNNYRAIAVLYVENSWNCSL